MNAPDDDWFGAYLAGRRPLLVALRTASDEADKLLPDPLADAPVRPGQMAEWWEAVQREDEAHQALKEYDRQHGHPHLANNRT